MRAKEKFDTLTHEVEGKIVSRLVSYNSNEISIDFVDGTALYIDSDHDELEVVLTETEYEYVISDHHLSPATQLSASL